MLKYDKFINESFLPDELGKIQSDLMKKDNMLLSDIKHIIMQEEGISEKNFTYINAMNNSLDKFMPNVKDDSDYFEDIKSFKDKRRTYLAEFMYDKYFKGKFKISM